MARSKKTAESEKEPELKQVVDAPAIPVKVVVPYTDENGTTHGLMGFLMTSFEFSEPAIEGPKVIRGHGGSDASGSLWVYIGDETYVIEAQDMIKSVIEAHRARTATAERVAGLKAEILASATEES